VSWTDASAVYYAVSFMTVVFNIVGAMFVVLGSTVVINTTMMVVFERRAEIGTLGAMGMREGELVRLFFLEALFLACLGALSGTAAGCALSLALGRTGLDLTAFMSGVNVEFPTLLYPVLNFRSVAGSLIMTVVLSALATLLPSWSAARIEPVDALRV
jgi:putative ABC transport system permease protein